MLTHTPSPTQTHCSMANLEIFSVKHEIELCSLCSSLEISRSRTLLNCKTEIKQCVNRLQKWQIRIYFFRFSDADAEVDAVAVRWQQLNNEWNGMAMENSKSTNFVHE